MAGFAPAMQVRSAPVRIVIADDHELMHVGLRTLLEGNSWIVCGEARNGIEAICKVQELAPDVIILDLTMLVMSGYDAVHEIPALHHPPKSSYLLCTTRLPARDWSARMLLLRNPKTQRK
jgi:DNA-binding NarL/FixJ family response regulator